MDVFKLTEQSVAVLFDLGSIDLRTGHIEKLPRYFSAFKKFMETGRIVKSILCIPPEAQLTETNFNMDIQKQPIQEILQTIAMDKSIESIICFGKFSTIFPLCVQLGIINVLIVSDEEITPFLPTAKARNIRILPGRVIYFLHNAFWWRVTPFEMLTPEEFNLGILPDNTLNELELMAQYALSISKNPALLSERNRVFEQIETLSPEHLSSKNALIACLGEDLKSNNTLDSERELLAQNLINLMADLDAIFLRLPAKVINRKDIMEKLMKFQTVQNLTLMFSLNSTQGKQLEKLCKENRKKKGNIPQRFTFSRFSLSEPLNPGKSVESKTYIQELTALKVPTDQILNEEFIKTTLPIPKFEVDVQNSARNINAEEKTTNSPAIKNTFRQNSPISTLQSRNTNPIFPQSVSNVTQPDSDLSRTSVVKSNPIFSPSTLFPTSSASPVISTLPSNTDSSTSESTFPSIFNTILVKSPPQTNNSSTFIPFISQNNTEVSKTSMDNNSKSEASYSKFCPKCGKSIRDKYAYCVFCGERVN